MAPIPGSRFPTPALVLLLITTSAEHSHAPGEVVEYQAKEGPLQTVLYVDNKHGTAVIVGGRNALYMLTPTLTETAKVSTGPEPDHIECPPHPLKCQHKRTPTNNDNQLLLQINSSGGVLACGTVWQGVCSVYKPFVNATAVVPMDKTVTVNYVASRETTVAFFGSGNLSKTLFAASTYDGRPVGYHPFAVSARDLMPSSFKLHAWGATSMSYVDVVQPLKRSKRVRYVYGFSHEGFAYFVTVRDSGTSWNTWLARVCEDDASFRTYTELLIFGSSNNLKYTIATAATITNVTLVVAFGIPNSNGPMNVSDPSLGSSICFFKMTAIKNSFADVVENCNAAKSTSRLSSLFHSNDTSLKCVRSSTGNAGEACIPGKNSYIEGRMGLPGQMSHILPGVLVTSLKVTWQNETGVIWVGDSQGVLYKVGTTFTM